MGALLRRRRARTSRCSPSTSTCALVPGVMTHVFASGVKADVRTAAGVGPPRHRERQPPVPHPRRVGAGRRPRARRAHRGIACTLDALDPTRDTIPPAVWDYIERKGLHGHGHARARPRRAARRRRRLPPRLRARRVARADAAHRRRAPRSVSSPTSASPTCCGTKSSRSCRRAKQPVFDATVRGTHNFVANGIVAHNSIEQDADVVLFIYRDEYYNPDSDQRGMAEIIVVQAPQRADGVDRGSRSATSTRSSPTSRASSSPGASLPVASPPVLFATLLALASAGLHAAWNLFVKTSEDRELAALGAVGSPADCSSCPSSLFAGSARRGRVAVPVRVVGDPHRVHLRAASARTTTATSRSRIPRARWWRAGGGGAGRGLPLGLVALRRVDRIARRRGRARVARAAGRAARGDRLRAC